MHKGVSGFIKGVGAVGNSYMHSGKKGLKKNVGRALRNVGELVDNVTSMF